MRDEEWILQDEMILPIKLHALDIKERDTRFRANCFLSGALHQCHVATKERDRSLPQLLRKNFGYPSSATSQNRYCNSKPSVMVILMVYGFAYDLC